MFCKHLGYYSIPVLPYVILVEWTQKFFLLQLMCNSTGYINWDHLKCFVISYRLVPIFRQQYNSYFLAPTKFFYEIVYTTPFNFHPNHEQISDPFHASQYVLVHRAKGSLSNATNAFCVVQPEHRKIIANYTTVDYYNNIPTTIQFLFSRAHRIFLWNTGSLCDTI